jgi:hypothetical protein
MKARLHFHFCQKKLIAQFPALATHLYFPLALRPWLCEAVFSATRVLITLDDELVLEGYYNSTTRGLWMLDINAVSSANSARQSRHQRDLVASFTHHVVSTISCLKYCQQRHPTQLRRTRRCLSGQIPTTFEATFKGHLDASVRASNIKCPRRRSSQRLLTTVSPSPIRATNSPTSASGRLHETRESTL